MLRKKLLKRQCEIQMPFSDIFQGQIKVNLLFSVKTQPTSDLSPFTGLNC